MELFSALGINWQLLVAQLINFVILIGVLSYFVYKPLLRLLDERRARIRKAVEDAKQIEVERSKIEEERKERRKLADKEAAKLLEEARAHAEGVRHELLGKAKQEADRLVAKAKDQIGQEKAKMMAEVQEELGKAVVLLAEKVLEREFTEKDQSRILQSVEKQIPALLR